MNNFMSRFPWSNAHELNLDWMISVIKEVDEALKSGFEKQLQAWIDKNYNQLLLNAVYDEDSETITFSRGAV